MIFRLLCLFSQKLVIVEVIRRLHYKNYVQEIGKKLNQFKTTANATVATMENNSASNFEKTSLKIPRLEDKRIRKCDFKIT